MPASQEALASIAVGIVASSVWDVVTVLVPSRLRYFFTVHSMRLIGSMLIAVSPVGFILSSVAIFLMRGWDEDNILFNALPLVFAGCGYVGFTLRRAARKIHA